MPPNGEATSARLCGGGRNVRKRYPDSPKILTELAACLCEVGMRKESDRLLRRAVMHFPDNASCHLAYARLAHDDKNWPEALSRWNMLSDRFGHVLGAVGGAKALNNLGRHAEAEQLLIAAKIQHPTEHQLTAELARMASDTDDWVTATERWSDMRKRFPASAEAYLQESRALRHLGRCSEADTILEEAFRRFPDNVAIANEHAALNGQNHRNGVRS